MNLFKNLKIYDFTNKKMRGYLRFENLSLNHLWLLILPWKHDPTVSNKSLLPLSFYHLLPLVHQSLIYQSIVIPELNLNRQQFLMYKSVQPGKLCPHHQIYELSKTLPHLLAQLLFQKSEVYWGRLLTKQEYVFYLDWYPRADRI